MDWATVGGQLITGGLTTLGTALGGASPIPGGAAAGSAIGSFVGEKICDLLGIEKTPQALSQAATDPTTILKLKELENNRELGLAQIALQTTQAYLADISSARSRQVEIAKSGGKDILFHTLGILSVVGFFAVLIFLLYLVSVGQWADVPQSIALLIGTMVGILASKYSTIIDYFYGYSKGGDNSSAQISSLIQNLNKT